MWKYLHNNKAADSPFQGYFFSDGFVQIRNGGSKKILIAWPA